MPKLIPNPSLNFMNHAEHTSCSIIYMLLIIQSYSTKTDHSRTNRHQITTLFSPSTLLRLRGLAQARQARSGEPLSPRRGLERASRNQRGISLRRDPSCLGEMFARSKFERVAWATLRINWFGRIPVCLA